MAAAAASLAGCGGGDAAGTGTRQTLLPGHIAAGGRTSGTVMATTASAPAQDMGAASREAGTPGIPQGAGGNTSGALLGGSTGGSVLGNTGEQTAAQRTPGQGAPLHAADPVPGTARAASAAAAASAAPPARAAAASQAAADAADARRLLDERMTVLAERVRARPAALPAR